MSDAARAKAWCPQCQSFVADWNHDAIGHYCEKNHVCTRVTIAALAAFAAEQTAALRAALEAIILASDQCQGHRDCGHSMEPWQKARALLADAGQAGETGVAVAPPDARPVETTDECFVVRGESWRALNRLFDLVQEADAKDFIAPSAQAHIEEALAAVERARQR